MAKLVSKTLVQRNVAWYAAYLVFAWGLYRLLFRLPNSTEELIIKPIIWLFPLIFILRKEKFGFSSLAITFKNLLPSLGVSLGFGGVFVLGAILSNLAKYGYLNFGNRPGAEPIVVLIGLSLATAVVEEMVFRGYLFGRLFFVTKSEAIANLLQAFLWMMIHVPITFLVWQYSFGQGVIYLMLTTVFGIGSAFILARTRNLAGSIFLHFLWGWAILLLR
jgi:membrane protease YdiL (CAAX protease family)